MPIVYIEFGFYKKTKHHDMESFFNGHVTVPSALLKIVPRTDGGLQNAK